MARKPSTLEVRVSSKADSAIREIRHWNANAYGDAHAESYIQFVKGRIASLANRYPGGKPVPTRPEFGYIFAIRRPRLHGHVIIYQIDHSSVVILNIYHTAQDWQRHALND